MIADTINRFIGRKPPDVQNNVHMTSPHPPIVIAAIADTHSNLKVALRPESFMDDDGGKSIASAVQFWLLDRYLEYIGDVKRIAAEHHAKVYAIGAGDMLEVDAKDRSNQLVNRNINDALNLAVDVNRKLRDIADRYILIRGTEAHVGFGAAFEEMLGERLDAERDANGHYSWWWWTGIVNGVYIEAAHHTTGGRRQAAKAGAIARLAEDTILEYAGTKDRIPDLVLRGHVHQFADSGSLVDGCRAITLPCWTFASAHVHRIGAGVQLPDIGGSSIVCENGNYEVINKIYKPARREPWRAN